jgi:hypothetical protein
MAAYIVDEKISFKIHQSLSNESISETDRDHLLNDLTKNYLSVGSLKIINKYEGADKEMSIIHLVRGRSLVFPEFRKVVEEVV